MYAFRFYPAVLFAFALNASTSFGQFQQIIPPQPIYQSGAVVNQGVVIGQPVQANPIWNSTCNCPPGGGDCQCKNLDCKTKFRYPKSGCRKVTPRYKKPVPCTIYGAIPKVTRTISCNFKKGDFEYATEVPQIHCVSETCLEIGKKLLQCLPGCCFEVCIPKFDCRTDIVECKLVPKTMCMEVWERQDRVKGKVYDVFVINNPDPSSPYHAGGMPAKWVILQCGTWNEFVSRFPGAISKTGVPLTKAKKGTKPKATSADVSIDMVFDKEKFYQNFNKKEGAAEKSDSASQKAEKVKVPRSEVG